VFVVANRSGDEGACVIEDTIIATTEPDSDLPPCAVRGCPWRGACPWHPHGDLEVDDYVDKVMRMRPFGAGRKLKRLRARYETRYVVESEVVTTTIEQRRHEEPRRRRSIRIVHPKPESYSIYDPPAPGDLARARLRIRDEDTRTEPRWKRLLELEDELRSAENSTTEDGPEDWWELPGLDDEDEHADPAQLHKSRWQDDEHTEDAATRQQAPCAPEFTDRPTADHARPTPALLANITPTVLFEQAQRKRAQRAQSGHGSGEQASRKTAQSDRRRGGASERAAPAEDGRPYGQARREHGREPWPVERTLWTPAEHIFGNGRWGLVRKPGDRARWTPLGKIFGNGRWTFARTRTGEFEQAGHVPGQARHARGVEIEQPDVTAWVVTYSQAGRNRTRQRRIRRRVRIPAGIAG
jgi:hypothetical protein